MKDDKHSILSAEDVINQKIITWMSITQKQTKYATRGTNSRRRVSRRLYLKPNSPGQGKQTQSRVQ